MAFHIPGLALGGRDAALAQPERTVTSRGTLLLLHLEGVLEGGGGGEGERAAGALLLNRKLMSLSHGQKLGQLADLAFDKLFTLVQPIRSQLDNDYNS